MTGGRIEGSDIEWTYDPDTGRLTLTGSGPMPDFLEVREERRWYSEALYKEYYEDYGYEVKILSAPFPSLSLLTVSSFISASSLQG